MNFARYARHPFWQAVAILVLAFVVIEWGIPALPGSALVPASVVLQCMATVLVGVLIYVSDSEDRWALFKPPLHAALVLPRRPPRWAGTLRRRLQSAARQLPGQRHDRAADRELRVLAYRQGGTRAAARGHAVELGDAAVGRLPHRAGDLVGDHVPVRSDGVEAENLGEDGKRDAGCGRRT